MPSVTWITDDDVLGWLGIEPAGDIDAAFVTACTNAANDWAYRRRQESGYTSDEPGTAPSDAVKLGTVIYGGTLYRERGSVDSFASYEGYTVQPIQGIGQVMRLLGIGRPQVA